MASFAIPVNAWVVPDGSSGNVAPAANRLKGTQTNAVHALAWLFDGGGSVIEQLYCTFIMPEEYVSGGSLLVTGTVNSTTSANTVMQASVSATSSGDADTFLEHAFSTAATTTIANNTTEARREIQGTITLNMNSAAAGDRITIRLFRDPAHASDTNTSDFEFGGARFAFTA